MSDQITISKTLSIRDCGKDEYWLQEELVKNPGILGLGDLELVHREKQQSSGGKLDFLFQDSADGSMYEVEVMLGATDESHIIRTIEYWDLERHRYPKRAHTAVLVAEKINRRFFNVIQILSLTVPIIAIQANIVEADGKRILHFTTILNAYQEIETDSRKKIGATSDKVVDETYWKNTVPWTLAHAKSIEKIVSPVVGKLEMNFREDAIRLLCDGEVYFRLNKNREVQKTSFYTWIKNEVKSPTAAMLDKNRVSYNLKPYGGKWQTLRFEVEQNFIQEKTRVFQKLAESVKESWLN